MTTEEAEGPAEVLAVRGLTLTVGRSEVPVVEGVDLTLRRGTTLGLVGASGSGKSLTAAAIINLLPAGVRAASGSVLYGGRDLLGVDRAALNRLRGREIGTIFQEPRRNLDPSFPVGAQIAEVVRVHEGTSRDEACRRAVDMLDRVRIPDAKTRCRDYPHQFSGGMCQRVMLAIALACSPKVLIADEPTTALDVTVQAAVLALIAELQAELDMAVLFVTHDLGVVAEICDRVSVLDGGHIVEDHDVATFFAARGSSASEGPSSSRPTPAARSVGMDHPAVLELRGVSKTFRRRRSQRTEAVSDVTLRISRGETLGLVGESGSGKSTVGRIALRLIEPDQGEVRLRGEALRGLSRRALRAQRRHMQMIFQDPFESLDPQMTIAALVAEPLAVHRLAPRGDLRAQTLGLLEQVDLGEEHLDGRPHEFSGGQLQRIAIARAMATDPDFIVCDEPVAALDPAARDHVLGVLRRLQSERSTAYLFISHDLSLVRDFTHRVAVLHGGRIVEEGPTPDLLKSPAHEYTRMLLDSVPGRSLERG